MTLPEPPAYHEGKPNGALKVRIQDRRVKVAERLRQHIPMSQIATELNITYGQVRDDKRAILKEWREQAVDDINEVIAQELADLDSMEKDAIAQYTKAVVTRPALAIRFMDIRLAIKDRRARILGINKPIKVTPTDPSGDHPYNPLDSIPDDELRQAAMLALTDGLQVVPLQQIDRTIVVGEVVDGSYEIVEDIMDEPNYEEQNPNDS